MDNFNINGGFNIALERIKEINSFATRVIGSPIAFESKVKATFANLFTDMSIKSGKQQFAPIIEQAAKEHNVDPKIVHAIIEQESGYNPNAVSRAGAKGLMQLMPDTARGLGVKDPLNPEENVRAGTKYFSSLLSHYHGNLTLALSAYNAGPNNVDRYKGVPPFRETKNYVNNIMSKISQAEA